MTDSRIYYLPVIVGLMAISACDAVGCGPGDPFPASWSKVSLEEAPELFELRHGHPAPIDIPAAFHLGQSHDAAMKALNASCPSTVRHSPTGEAFFIGCRLPDESDSPARENISPALHSLRVGFWPRIGKRVATLEVKRDNVTPGVVWRRFRQILDELSDNPPRIRQRRWTGNILIVGTSTHRLFADWDEGDDGPTHIVVGLAPEVSESVVE